MSFSSDMLTKEKSFKYIGVNAHSSQYSNLNLNTDAKLACFALASNTFVSGVKNNGFCGDQIYDEPRKWTNKNSWKSSEIGRELHPRRREFKQDFNSILKNNIVHYENAATFINSVIDSPKSSPADYKSIHSHIIGPIIAPFEYPRQEDDKKTEPEVMQFKASQKLLDPKQSGKSGLNLNLSSEQLFKRCGTELSGDKVAEVMKICEAPKRPFEGIPTTGEVVNGYTIRGFLGSGGYGAVCFAEKDNLFFALKFWWIKHDLRHPGKEFQTLYENLQHERHDRLLTAYEWNIYLKAGEKRKNKKLDQNDENWRGGTHKMVCMVMKYVGVDMKTFLDLQKDGDVIVPDSERLEMMERAFLAVQALHERNFVHHDIKVCLL